MKRLNQEILIIAVLTLTLSLLWAFLNINNALKKSEKTLLTPQETKLLVPKMDAFVFDELKKRKN